MQLTAEVTTVHTRHPFIIARGGTSEWQVVWVRLRDVQSANDDVEGWGEAAPSRFYGETADSVYLTVTGLSAEAGDDGQVGRGNRVNGLITPYRPMSLEAAAGKNPVTHVGKLYNLMASRIAHAVVAGVPGVNEANCTLLSQIGRPIDAPQVFDVKLRLADPAALASLRARIEAIAQDELSGIGRLWTNVLAGQCPVW